MGCIVWVAMHAGLHCMSCTAWAALHGAALHGAALHGAALHGGRAGLAKCWHL